LFVERPAALLLPAILFSWLGLRDQQ